MAFAELIPALLCPLYLFGGAAPWGTSDSAFVRFLLYLLTQVLWLLPVFAFFFGLDIYRRGWKRYGIAIVLTGDIIAALGFWMLLR